MKPASPIGIDSVTYGVQDISAGARFFDEFGLTQAERGQRGVTYITGEGTAVHLRLADDSTLPPPIEGGSTIREVVWGVRSKTDLDSIAAELSEDREVSTGPDGKLCSVDPNGLAISFRVSQRKEIPAPPPQPPRVNARTKFYERAAPEHIAHVVFFTPNLNEMADFYMRRLGFLLSDTLTGFGVFLRCSSDHHNLFLINHERKGLNHVSFRLKDFDEIMAGKQFLEKKGWRPVWGPGRHVIGSNLFYYFANPCGAFVEYYADMDCITNPDSWIAREWTPSPEVLAAWGPAIPEEMQK
jgi:catechol 2,3-dioxygenase-like lactoylglutathione lyase family enzyme